jgi:hypothetical protein
MKSADVDYTAQRDAIQDFEARGILQSKLAGADKRAESLVELFLIT